MPPVTLTDVTLRTLKPVPGRQVTYTDKSLKGFGVRVTPAGHASYVLVMGANRQRIKLGDVGIIRLAEARAKARTLLAEKQLGVHRAASSPMYKSALDTFLETAEKRCKPRTVRDYRRLLTRHGFGLEKLDDITSREIQKKLDKLGEVAGEQAHAHAAFQIFFRFCVRRHFLDRNPMERVERPTKTHSRDRILTCDELAQVWNASEGMFGAIIRLCILLGQRRSEIAQIRWDWLDGDLLTFPADVTKNKRRHSFPIGPMAEAIINEQPRCDDTPYIFPARKTWRQKSSVYNAWGKDKPKLDERSGVTDWVIHDLRRTLVSNWAALGVRIEVTEKYINHISGTTGGLVGIYNRYPYLEEMRDAVRRYEDWLQSLLAQGQPERRDAPFEECCDEVSY